MECLCRKSTHAKKPCNKRRCEKGMLRVWNLESTDYGFCRVWLLQIPELAEHSYKNNIPESLTHAVSDITIHRDPPPLLLEACTHIKNIYM